MRQSYKVDVWNDDSGDFVGVALSHGGCAEHEWGIQELCNILGVDTSIMGIDGRTVQSAKSVVFLKGRGWRAICLDKYGDLTAEKIANHHELRDIIRTKNDVNLFAAWSGQNFCFGAKKKEGYELVEKLYKASQNNDLVVYLGGADSKNPFSRSGLVLAIKSKIDDEMIDLMLSSDKRNFEKRQLHESLGLEPQVREQYKTAGKFCFAVSPYWVDEVDLAILKQSNCADDKGLKTAYRLVYWINSSDMWGWFTVEDIQEWLNKQTGRIIDATIERANARAKIM